MLVWLWRLIARPLGRRVDDSEWYDKRWQKAFDRSINGGWYAEWRYQRIDKAYERRQARLRRRHGM